MISRVGQHAAFVFLPTGAVFAESLIVFPLETYSAFAALQSRPHEIWVRFFSSSLEERLRYTPSDCFETFPFPRGWDTHQVIEAAGKKVLRVSCGPDEGQRRGSDADLQPIQRPRGTTVPENCGAYARLHESMDRAVLDAYGWYDISNSCEFLLDYEIDEEEWGRRKKPWRYRWPDDVHDEVLARLLALNAERAREERVGGRKTQRPRSK